MGLCNGATGNVIEKLVKNYLENILFYILKLMKLSKSSSDPSQENLKVLKEYYKRKG